MLLISYTLSIILSQFGPQLLSSNGILDTWQPLTTSAQPLREVAMVLGPLQAQYNVILDEKTTANIRLPCGVFFSIWRLSGVFNSTRDLPGGKQEFVGGFQRIWR